RSCSVDHSTMAPQLTALQLAVEAKVQLAIKNSVECNLERDLAKIKQLSAARSAKNNDNLLLQRQRQEMRKDEFESTAEFEKRKQALGNAIQQGSDEISAIDKSIQELGDPIAKLKAIQAAVVVPVRITLVTENPRYDADKRSMTCR